MRRPAVRRCLTAFTCGLIPALLAGCNSGPPDPKISARYITARDGTRLAVDVWLPGDLAAAAKIPAILRLTRYWRDVSLTAASPPAIDDASEAARFTRQGYAWVVADVRGTGASFGVSRAPWSPEEVDDYRDIIDWIVAQTWSDGQVGAVGISYEGNAAALTAALEHPAVKAVVPRFFNFDPYAAPARPGGILAERFVRGWSDQTRDLDDNDLCALAARYGVDCSILSRFFNGVKPVDEDDDGALLDAAVAEHAANVDIYSAVENAVYSDDRFGADADDPTLTEISLFGHAAPIDRAAVPWYAWASWFDAGTATGALSAFQTFTNPQRVIIGAWDHGAFNDADPFNAADAAVTPTESDQFADILAFLDQYLKSDSPPAPTREIRYYTLGEGVWRTTTVWPPADVVEQTWSFSAGRSLIAGPAPTPGGRDDYAVDFTASTGIANRWLAQLGIPDVVYGDRALADQRLLTYTSPPLAADLRVTGHPLLNLYLTSTATDGAIFAYLEDVGPDGQVTYITEGQLRLIHRAVSADPPPYEMFGPYHSFRRGDAQSLVPGEVSLVPITLHPTSALLRAGHCLRIAIAGHDAGAFERIPAAGSPTLTVLYGDHTPSQLVLPVAP